MVKNSLLKNVFLLVGGTTIAQLISVLASPILTRLYSPEEYGSFALFTSICAIFTIISCLTLEQAIALPKSCITASALYRLAVATLVIVVSVVCVVVIGAYIGDWYAIKDKLNTSMLLIPVAVCFTGLFMINNFWAIRNDKYNNISKAKVAQVIVQVSSQIVLSVISSVGLIWGYIVGTIVSSSFLLVTNYRLGKLVNVSWKRVIASLSRYRRFPIYSTWEVLFNAVSLHSAPIIFALFFGNTNAGLFALSFRIMSLPVTVIGMAVGHGFYGKAKELRDRTVAAELLEKTVVNLLKLGLIPFIPFALFGPEIFSFLFGPSWELAGNVAQWITLWVVFQLVASPLSAIFPIYEKQVQGLTWQLFLVVSRLSALYVAFLQQDFMLAVLLYCIVSATAYFLLLIWVSLLVNIPVIELIFKLSTSIFKVIVGFAPLILMKFYMVPNLVLFFVMSLSSAFLLIVIHQKEIVQLIKKYRK